MAKTSTESAPASVDEIPPPGVQGPDREPAAIRSTGGTNRYRVTHGARSGVVTASDENEAWAIFCDSHKKWPSPKGRKVELLTD